MCVCVCLSVCVSDSYLLLWGLRWVDVLYMGRSRIYPGVPLSILKIRPTNRPDAIVRKVDAIGKNRSKMAYFSRFSDNLTYFPIPYQLKFLNVGR